MTWIGGIPVGGVLLAAGFVKGGDFFRRWRGSARQALQTSLNSVANHIAIAVVAQDAGFSQFVEVPGFCKVIEVFMRLAQVQVQRGIEAANSLFAHQIGAVE